MVNYLYDLDDIEKNHEAYAEGRAVVASNAVQPPAAQRAGDRARSRWRADSGFHSIGRGFMLWRRRMRQTR